MSNTFEPLNKPDSTIQDAGLYQGQVLFSNTVYFKHTIHEAFEIHKLYGYPDTLQWVLLSLISSFLTHLFSFLCWSLVMH